VGIAGCRIGLMIIKADGGLDVTLNPVERVGDLK